MEVAVDECVSGKEVLRLLAGLEALHLSFSSACGSMRVLSTIVEVATLSVLDIGQQMTLRHPIASQLVGDDHSRHVLQALQQTPEEPLGSFPITSLLDQNIEDDTVLIHGTPKIMLNAQDPDEHLASSRGGIPPPRAPRTVRDPLEFIRLPMFSRRHAQSANARRGLDSPGEPAPAIPLRALASGAGV